MTVRKRSLLPEITAFPSMKYRSSLLVNADCFDFLKQLPDQSIDAVVTDPPYSTREFTEEEIKKTMSEDWRMFDPYGSVRMRKTNQWMSGTGLGERRLVPNKLRLDTEEEREELYDFFMEFTYRLLPKLKPAANVLIASNSALSILMFSAMADAGLEYRGQVIRLIAAFRGMTRLTRGFDSSPFPRSLHEPWGVFRKRLPKGMNLKQCLAEYGTGGFRRISELQPFSDVIRSENTSRFEKKIAEHPSLKPQSLMRQLVHSVLPFGEGVVYDLFMGAGSTIAAAEALNYRAVGVERHPRFYELACNSVEKLRRLNVKRMDKGHFILDRHIPEGEFFDEI